MDILSIISAVADKIHDTFPADAAVLNFPIKPVPASRPKISKWGVYYGKNYTAWRNEARKYIRDFEAKYSGPIVVLISISVEKPKHSKRDWPNGDVDNYAKGPLDSITENKTVWRDDDQVIGMWVSKQWATTESPAGIKVYIYGVRDEESQEETDTEVPG